MSKTVYGGNNQLQEGHKVKLPTMLIQHSGIYQRTQSSPTAMRAFLGIRRNLAFFLFSAGSWVLMSERASAEAG